MGGQSAPSPPQPSPAERAYSQAAASLLRLGEQFLREQASEEEPLTQLLYNRIGIQPTFADPNGPEAQKVQAELDDLIARRDAAEKKDRPLFKSKIEAKQSELDDIKAGQRIVGYNELPDPLRDRRKAIEADLLSRQERALRGDIEEDPAIRRLFEDEQLAMGEILRKQLGPGWQSSSPGIEALADLGQRRAESLYDMRMGQLFDLSNLSNQSRAANLAETGTFLSGATDISGLKLRSLGGASQIGQGFGQLAGQIANANLQRSQIAAQQGGGVGTFGQIFGPLAGTGAQLGSAYLLSSALGGSSEIFKEDINELSEEEILALLGKVESTPIFSWRYKGDEKKRIGPVLERAPELFADGPMLDVVSTLGLLLVAVKQLLRERHAAR